MLVVVLLAATVNQLTEICVSMVAHSGRSCVSRVRCEVGQEGHFRRVLGGLICTRHCGRHGTSSPPLGCRMRCDIRPREWIDQGQATVEG